ncbi:MAG TPA: sigma-70 family RNA polymerase sigma factor [Chloroflexi bacterium]|nr:sigma-70 family RNA polymerase sigma factor [Chloroflexota bacterium]
MGETTLIQAAQRGNLDAFNELVLTYQHRVYNLAYRILGDPAAASDATQDAFIAAYRKISTFRGGSFPSWLLRIVANRCYDELRRQKRRPITPWEEFGDVDTETNPALINGSESPEEHVQRWELARVLQAAITSLPADQRVVLVLSDVEGMAYAEIGAAVGIPVGTVKSRLARARARLRDLLQAQGELLPRVYRLEGED